MPCGLVKGLPQPSSMFQRPYSKLLQSIFLEKEGVKLKPVEKFERRAKGDLAFYHRSISGNL